MLDLKAFKISNIIMLIGLCVCYFLVVPIQIKQSAANRAVEEKCYLDCRINEVDHEITEKETEIWLTEIRELHKHDEVKFIQVQLQGGECVVPDEVFDVASGNFSKTLIETVTNYLNGSELYIVFEGSVVLSNEYRQLEKICNMFGLHVEVTEHMETGRSDREIVQGKFYKYLGIITVGCSFIFLFVLEFFWFQNRRKAWYIRRVFGVTIVSLIKELAVVQSVLMVSSLILTLPVLKGYYHFHTMQMVRGSIIVLIEFLIIVLLWIFAVMVQTSPIRNPNKKN